MIINPFIDIKKEESNTLNVNINELQKYVIDNYIDYLKNDLKDALIEKLEEHICTNYMITKKDEIDKIIDKLISKIFGYDVLQKYIVDENVSDIRVVKWNLIYIKKIGNWEKVDETFESPEDFENYIRYIVLKNDATINFDVPIVVVSDKKYNLRIEAGISPVNVMSSSLVIRIHRIDKKVSLETLFLEDEMLDAKSYKIILDIIKNGKNVILAGKGGSGKTTLLREIINKLPDEKAITIAEETAELYIKNKNVIEREIIDNREESKKINLEKLLKHSLVMSNDVLVVGELKGSETAVFLDAISTGHIGLGTVHADSVKNTLDRLVTLVKRDSRCTEYSEEFISRLLASSVNYFIYMQNFKIYEIAQVSYDRKKSKVNIDIIYERGKI